MATIEDRVNQSTDEKIANRSASGKEGAKASDQYDSLPDDIFDDLNGEEERREEQATNGEGAPTAENELPDDIFDDLDVAEHAAGRGASVAPLPALGGESSEDYAADEEFKSEVESEGTNVGQPTGRAAASEKLAAAICKRLEAAVSALLEEQLPTIVKRIIEEEIK